LRLGFACYLGDVARRHWCALRIIEPGTYLYSRTHDHSSMAVASSDLVSTHFDVPVTEERVPSQLVVVANGIPSAPVAITVD
jgi:hypothetical protein